MRTITTHVTVYRYEELSDEAKQTAVRAISEKLNGPWWDQADNDAISEVIVAALAEALLTPGWNQYGVSDFPGIPGIKLVEWDLERGRLAKFTGTLTRENAPVLPWVAGIDSVLLSNPDIYRSVWVEVNDDDAVTDERIAAMRTATDAAIESAWQAGRREMDYKESDEYASEWIEANEPEFTEDGSHYR